jgi:hypothetical protein
VTHAVLFIRGVPFKPMMKVSKVVGNWLFNELVSPQKYSSITFYYFFFYKKKKNKEQARHFTYRNITLNLKIIPTLLTSLYLSFLLKLCVTNILAFVFRNLKIETCV